MTEINPHTNTWLTVVNPNAGSKKGEKDWHKIAGRLRKEKLSFSEVFTQEKGHAIEITRENIEKGYRKFLVVGGDGTLNEVANGIYKQNTIPPSEFVVAMIPVGTGNDWCRSFNVPFTFKKAIKLIKQYNTHLQDVGLIKYQGENGLELRYFINVAGMGYDAVVAAKTNKDKAQGRGGVFIYLKNLLTSLLLYKHSQTEIVLDKERTIKHKTFSLSVGIGKYNGGGMMQLPHAVTDDGIFDITLIKKLGKFTVMKQVKNLYNGSFINHPKVETFRSSSIEIQSNPPISLEADGESLGHSPFEFEIIPQSLRVVCG